AARQRWPSGGGRTLAEDHCPHRQRIEGAGVGDPRPRRGEHRHRRHRAATAVARRRIPRAHRPPRGGKQGGEDFGMSTAEMTEVEAGTARGGPAQALRDTLVIAWRNIRGGLRVPDNQVYMFIQPIMFVLLFAYVFGGAIQVPGVNYREFLMAGIFVQTMAFSVAPASIGLADDMHKGLVDRFRSLPMARSGVIAGRVVADLANQFVVLVIMMVCGVIVGWRFHEGIV